MERAAEASQGLGLFVRSLVGLDRQAAKEALAGVFGRQVARCKPNRAREFDR